MVWFHYDGDFESTYQAQQRSIDGWVVGTKDNNKESSEEEEKSSGGAGGEVGSAVVVLVMPVLGV
jgi:hypothetical protein